MRLVHSLGHYRSQGTAYAKLNLPSAGYPVPGTKKPEDRRPRDARAAILAPKIFSAFEQQRLGQTMRDWALRRPTTYRESEPSIYTALMPVNTSCPERLK